MIQIQRQANAAVTDYYLDVIARMCSSEEDLYDADHSISECQKEDIIIVPTAIEFLKVYLRGFRRVIYWMQGIDGEESYLKHHKIWRKTLLDWAAKFALKNAKAVFFVSNEMKRYEEKKFRLHLGHKSFVMPCFNVSEETGLFFDQEKYAKNVFAYVGSLSKWQCFPETVDFYKQIEDKYDNVELKVFTFSKDEAERIIKEKEIKHYSVSTVSPDQMTSALREVKFGFVLRENIAVNKVATPTKLSSYLSAGVIPIYSTCLVDFHENTRGMKHVVPAVDHVNLPPKLDEFMRTEIDYDTLCKEYRMLFDTYYNPDYYASVYKDRLVRLLCE